MTTQDFHTEFAINPRKHILMMTHGIHEWQVVPGLLDTGGQNVFVNQLTDTLVDLGYKVTIANRGGYKHPTTGKLRNGIDYRDANSRIVFTEDGCNEMVRKEDLPEHVEPLSQFLYGVLKKENMPVDLIISHYWDGGKIGILLNSRLDKKAKHVWVPHSVGTVKKRNVKPERYNELRIDERIEIEKGMIHEFDAVAATSGLIRSALLDDYGSSEPMFLPPCVNAERFFPHSLDENHPIYTFLADALGDTPERVRSGRIITEISRTDKTKQKDVLIKAFAQVVKKFPDALLAVTIDKNSAELYHELTGLVHSLDLEKHVIVLGNVWEKLPDIYAATYLYCSPSVMEGFGMAVQEAAATKVPVIASDLVPFVVDYILGEHISETTYNGCDKSVKEGEGGIVVPARDVNGFAGALIRLFENRDMYAGMAQRAYDITIPYFTWKSMTQRFLDSIEFDR